MSDSMHDGERWMDVNARPAELDRRLANDFAPSTEERDEQLRQRTRQWAAMPEEAQSDDWIEVLAFSLGGETYAVESEHVALVMPLPQYTPLPGLPPHVLGIVNVRGRVVSVLDLRVLLELPISGLSDKNFLAILHGFGMEFGVLVDRVLGIDRLHRSSLQAEVANLSGIRAAYLLGVTPDQWTVLDGARLLSDPTMRINN